MTDNERATLGLSFLLGGHAYFTISNPAGDHYSFRVAAPKEQDAKRPLWFVAVLTGPDNTKDYTYAGILSLVDRITPLMVLGQPSGTGKADKVPAFKLTGKSTYTDDSKPVRVLRWALQFFIRGEAPPEGYHIQHMGRCAVCGRALTDPESIKLGIGPVCREG